MKPFVSCQVVESIHPKKNFAIASVDRCCHQIDDFSDPSINCQFLFADPGKQKLYLLKSLTYKGSYTVQMPFICKNARG